MDRYSILELYMVMGGIPHYLKEIKGGKSATLNIDEICFSKDGLLIDEFPNLYEALFSKPDRHIDFIKVLAVMPKGLTRSEIIKQCSLSSGGTTTRILDGLKSLALVNQQVVMDDLFQPQ